MALIWSQTPHLLPDIEGCVGFKMTMAVENLKSKTSHENQKSKILLEKNQKYNIWHPQKSKIHDPSYTPPPPSISDSTTGRHTYCHTNERSTIYWAGEILTSSDTVIKM